MNRKQSRFTQSILLIAILTLLAVQPAMAAGVPAAALWGASAARADQDLTVADMLKYAIQDEYLARAEYIAIMARFGVERPFSNIKNSEDNHVSWLTEAFRTYGLPVPADEGFRYAVTPATLKEANETGVRAEIDNIAMYDLFLAAPSVRGAEYAALRDLFARLKQASENHLRAFRNQLAKY